MMLRPNLDLEQIASTSKTESSYLQALSLVNWLINNMHILFYSPINKMRRIWAKLWACAASV